MSATLSPHALALAALGLAHRNPALLALGHKPALLFGVAENSIPGDPLSETPEQALW